jgi:hypothetical protein
MERRMRSKVLVFGLVIAFVYLAMREAQDGLVSVNGEGQEGSRPSESGAAEARMGSTAQSSAAHSPPSPSTVAGHAGSGADPAREERLETNEPYDDDETVWGNGLHEDHSVYASEPSQQFWQWRRTLADEAPDPAWAEQLRRDLTRRAHGGVLADATFHQIDCRETICQLYLQTDEPATTAALVAAMRQDRIEIERQEMARHVQLEGAPRGGTTYELVVRRARPAWMPPHVPGAGPAYRAALDARDDESE